MLTAVLFFFFFIYPPQSFPIMVGDMDNTGSLNAQVIHQLANRIRSKVVMQVCTTLQSCSQTIKVNQQIPHIVQLFFL